MQVMEIFKINSIVRAVRVTPEKIRTGVIRNVDREKIIKIFQESISVVNSEGTTSIANIGDWIIRTQGDELCVMNDNIFRTLAKKI